MYPIAIVLCLFMSSCATIFQPGPDTVRVQTDPPGAAVYLDGNPVGKAPVELEVKRAANGIMRVEMPGYHPIEFKLPTSVNGTTFLNILFGLIGGPIAFAIDGFGGNMSAWEPPSMLQLVPVTETAMTDEEVLAMVRGERKPAGPG